MAPEAAPRHRGGHAHRLGGQVVGKAQHVMQHRAQGTAGTFHQHRAARRGTCHLRRGQREALGAGKRLEHVGGVEFGPAHGKPAAAALAQRGAGHRPFLDIAAVGIGIDRAVAVSHGDTRGIDLGNKPVRPRIHRDLIAALRALPFEMHPVEVEVQARHGGVVAQIVGLRRVDGAHEGQRPAPDHETPGDRSDPRRAQGRGHVAQRVGGQRRIAAPGQHQIARHPPALHRPVAISRVAKR
ncbi:hypothetical protein AKL17_0295 [Frigidibacter mobilis]|uniref:Uncharacterized protein n=1 Tax=Frigidibacter mobilis TaxID=1335048 RepID=A0A159YYW5_9RHOB|nr:hypothetical protein AKL17_0295 [Frigidibacter mobilis]